MSDVLLDQYSRLLNTLPAADPWPALEASGFLDLLAPEAEGGGGASLEELLPLALETGRRALGIDILTAMARRVAEPVPQALAALLATGEMAGAIVAVEALTMNYVRTRKQFGREIGRFQAIQHQIAVLAEEVIASGMAAEMAFVGDPCNLCERRVALAKVRCGQAAFRASAIAHAVHGAIGVSEEFALHRYTRRLRHLGMAHGGEVTWARRLGAWALSDRRDIVSLAQAL